MKRGISATLLALGLSVWSVALHAAQDLGPFEELAERVRTELTAGGERTERALSALRELRDPALKPLFGHLAASEMAEARRQGILGRAELESPTRLDPFLLGRISAPVEQLSIVEDAVYAGFVDSAACADMLVRSDLQPSAEVYLRLVLAGMGEAVDLGRARDLGEATDRWLRCRAGLLLLVGSDPSGGDDAGLPPILLELVPPNTGADRDRLRALLADVGRLRLTRGSPLVHAALAAAGDDRVLRASAIEALLAVDPEEAGDTWLEAFADPAGETADRLRLALMAVRRTDAPAAMLEKLAASDAPLEASLGHAALALRAGEVEPLLALVGTGYSPGIAWLLSSIEGLADADAITVLTAAIGVGADAKPTDWDLREQGVRAAELLGSRSPDRFLELLKSAADEHDLLAERTLLLGAIRTSAPTIGPRLASHELRDPESAALAAIATGRWTTGDAPPVLVETLRAIAAGQGGLHPARRVQAAWLAIRLAGEDRPALARILAPDPT